MSNPMSTARKYSSILHVIANVADTRPILLDGRRYVLLRYLRTTFSRILNIPEFFHFIVEALYSQ